MSTHTNTVEKSFMDVRSFVERQLDLGITMIEDTCLRMPYAAVGLAINPVQTTIVRMPYAAAATTSPTVRTILWAG